MAAAAAAGPNAADICARAAVVQAYLLTAVSSNYMLPRYQYSVVAYLFLAAGWAIADVAELGGHMLF